MVVLPGYQHFFLDRNNKQGGGISIHVKQGIKYELLHPYLKSTDDFEILSLKCNEQMVSILYCPPSASFNPFCLFMDQFLELENDYCLILGGDFSVNILENSPVSLQLNNITNTAGFMNMITSPTRITLSTSSAIDLFVTNVSTHVKVTGTIVTDIRDHNVIFISFLYRNIKKTTFRTSIAFQDISDRNLHAFRHALQNVDWTAIFPNLVPMTRIMYL